MSSDRFLDTNILVYAYSERGDRTTIARQLLFEGGVVQPEIKSPEFVKGFCIAMLMRLRPGRRTELLRQA